MADKKISQLTGATTPLAGTEEVPLVQSGITKKVSIADITSGRAISASEVTVSGQTANTLVAFDGSKNVVSVTTSATTPLAGTEEASIVQSGAAKKTSVNSFVDGRTISPLAAQLNGAGVSGSPISVNTNHGTFVGLGNPSWAAKDVLSTSYDADLDGTNILVPSFGGNTAKLRLNISGDVVNAVGNFVVGTAGKGIDFSADPNPGGMTSELLDDYEEGTWTPTLSGNFGASGMTYTTQIGRYTKVGNIVHCYVKLQTSGGTLSGFACGIEGWPFTSQNDAVPMGMLYFEGLATNYYTLGVQLTSNFAYLRGLTAAGAAMNFVDSTHINTATTLFEGWVSYRV